MNTQTLILKWIYFTENEMIYKYDSQNFYKLL